MQKGLPHRCTPFLYTLFTNQKADKLLSSRDFQVNFHSTRAKPINVKDRSLFCSFFNTAVLVTVNFSSYPKQSGQYFHLPDKDCTTCWMIPGCQQTRPKESSTAAEGNPLPLLSTGSVISVTVQQIQSQGLTLLERSTGPPCSVTRSWEVLGQEVFSAAKPTQIIPQNKPGGFFFFFFFEHSVCFSHTSIMHNRCYQSGLDQLQVFNYIVHGISQREISHSGLRYFHRDLKSLFL